MTLTRVRTAIPTPYFLAPINTGLAAQGSPTQELIEFHRSRSGKGIGVAYVGNVAIGRNLATNGGTLYFGIDLSPWHALADAIQENGSVPAIQLAGRVGTAPSRSWKPRDPAQTLRELKNDFRSLPTDRLRRVVEAFGAAARNAWTAGFRIIQIHAAHGYLISQSLNLDINTRDDVYGDRFRLLREVLGATRAEASGALLDIRISLSDFGNHPVLSGARAEVFSSIVDLGSDLISISSGSYDLQRKLIYPSREVGHNVYLPQAHELARRYTSVLWNVAGNLRELPPLPALPSNLTFSFGRPLIADPEYIEKLRTNRAEEINNCRWSGRCHYYSRGRPHIECPVSVDLRPKL